MPKNVMRFFYTSLIFTFIVSGLLCRNLWAQEDVTDSIDSKEATDVYIIKNDLVSIKVYGLTRISISNPDIADYQDVNDQQILMLGKTSGQTMLSLWDELGKRTMYVHVSDIDLNQAVERIKQKLEQAGITTVNVEPDHNEGKVVVSGEIVDAQASAVGSILSPFGATISNQIKIETIQDLVQIDVQVSELSQTLAKSLGVDWTNVGQGIALSYAETLPAQTGKFKDLFKIGDFYRTNTLAAAINLLIAEGKGKVLSKPSLVVKNNNAASFQVGGQVPIVETTVNEGGSVSQNVSYQSYGVQMSITPKIVKENLERAKIDIVLNVSVSSIDAGTAVGENVGFNTRSVNTSLLLDEDQTIVLAGFIQHNASESIKKIPFLGDLPVVGLLFRQKSTPAATTETELAISLTPRILRQKKIEPFDPSARKESEGTSFEQKEEEGLQGAAASLEGQKEESSVSADNKDVSLEGQKKESSFSADNKNVSLEEKKDIVAPDLETTPEAPQASTSAAEKETSSSSLPVSGVEVTPSSSVPAEEEHHPTQQQDPMKEESNIEEPSSFKTESGVMDVPQSGAAIVDKEKSFSIGQELGIAEKKDQGDLSIAPKEGKSQEDTFEGSLEDQALNEISDELTGYIQSIQKKISQAISFPYEAKEKGWEGTVKLSLHVLKDGQLSESTIKESSGHNLLDIDALNTAQVVAPYPPFPSEVRVEELIITIPIVYSQQTTVDVDCDNPSSTVELKKS